MNRATPFTRRFLSDEQPMFAGQSCQCRQAVQQVQRCVAQAAQRTQRELDTLMALTAHGTGQWSGSAASRCAQCLDRMRATCIIQSEAVQSIRSIAETELP